MSLEIDKSYRDNTFELLNSHIKDEDRKKMLNPY